nr:MAG TPA: Putative modification methylase [Caudoviricetes sp.]
MTDYTNLPPLHHEGVYPWSVLRSDAKEWQRRKKELIASGIDDLAGRADIEIFRHGKSGRHHKISGGKSRFDPVLADTLLNWYAPRKGLVYDPFAGGITRGAMAHHNDMLYYGRDLSENQIKSNRELAARLGLDGVAYEVGDATRPSNIIRADFVLTCPPYHSAEKYGDDPKDLSRMGWDQHLEAVREAAFHCYDTLAMDRFIAWVVGDLRAPNGALRLLPERTAIILEEVGFTPVNQHILVTPVGTMHRMLRRWWTNTRSAGRTHQHVIVMVKGDRRKAVEVIRNAAHPIPPA